jgi:catechol 2,3-dioxygenase-like lactoylglutathione lyase family enzyme
LLKIDSVMYRVGDLAKAEAYYTGVLGLRRLWADAERNMIGLGLAESDAEVVIHTDPAIPSPDFSFLVADVETLCEEHEKGGQRFILRPIEVRTGSFAVLADPDGNPIPIIDLKKFGGKPRYD